MPLTSAVQANPAMELLEEVTIIQYILFGVRATGGLTGMSKFWYAPPAGSELSKTVPSCATTVPGLSPLLLYSAMVTAPAEEAAGRSSAEPFPARCFMNAAGPSLFGATLNLSMTSVSDTAELPVENDSPSGPNKVTLSLPELGAFSSSNRITDCPNEEVKAASKRHTNRTLRFINPSPGVRL